MFARIIPLVRTPLGVDGFDYAIPEGEKLEVGDLVWIPFRRRRCVGLVSELLTTSPFASRALKIEGRYAGIRLPRALPALVASTARRTFSSSPTVLSSWLRTLPKRPEEKTFKPKVSEKIGLQATWTTGPTAKLLAHADKNRLHERVLIVTPWITLAKQLHEALPESHVLHSDMADGEAFQQWTQFLSKDAGCLITTKIGAWLASAADLVLLHEPEQDDHKQDESSPRYDARRVLLWCAERNLTEVQSYGLTPPIHAEKEAPTLEDSPRLHIYHPQGRSQIRMLQADSLQALLDHAGPRLVIHPISGSLSRLTCRDCNWQATCAICHSGLGADRGEAICRVCRKRSPLPESCANCGGADLSKSLPGVERLRTEWQTHFPDTPVEWCDLKAETLEAPIPTECLVVVTDAAWIGVGEDIRKRERQCIAVRRLIDRVSQANGTLILQCQEAFAPLLEEWLTSEGMKRFIQTIRQEREAFEYPPSKRVVKIIIRGTEEAAEAWRVLADRALRKKAWGIHWRGPMPVEHQSASRGARMILHAVLPPSVTENELIEAFTPFASKATIDLDPIAFLR